MKRNLPWLANDLAFCVSASWMALSIVSEVVNCDYSDKEKKKKNVKYFNQVKNCIEHHVVYRLVVVPLLHNGHRCNVLTDSDE